MPYYTFKEIWTPFKLLRVSFFIEMHDKSLWVKVGNNKRRKLFGR